MGTPLGDGRSNEPFVQVAGIFFFPFHSSWLCLTNRAWDISIPLQSVCPARALAQWKNKRICAVKIQSQLSIICKDHGEWKWSASSVQLSEEETWGGKYTLEFYQIFGGQWSPNKNVHPQHESPESGEWDWHRLWSFGKAKESCICFSSDILLAASDHLSK